MLHGVGFCIYKTFAQSALECARWYLLEGETLSSRWRFQYAAREDTRLSIKLFF